VKLLYQTLKGLALIAMVALILFLVKDNFVGDQKILSPYIFNVIQGGVLGLSFVLATRMCLRELRKTKSDD
jgi:hypothetical protein